MPTIIQNCLIILALAGHIAQSGGIFRVHQTQCPNEQAAIHIHSIWEFTDSILGIAQTNHKNTCCDHSHPSVPAEKHSSEIHEGNTLHIQPAESTSCCFEHSRTISPEYILCAFSLDEISDYFNVLPLDSFIIADNPAFCHLESGLFSPARDSFPPRYVVLQTLLI